MAHDNTVKRDDDDNNAAVRETDNETTIILQVEGFKMNVVYYDLYQATRLEKFVTGSYHY